MSIGFSGSFSPLGACLGSKGGGAGGAGGPSGLYAFTTATFGGNAGRAYTGPSLSQARSGLTGGETDTWKNSTDFFNTSSGIQYWTVPSSGIYQIEAHGGRGGFVYSGGSYGARMRGDFTLVEGEIIRMIVGQQGMQGGHPFSGSTGLGGGGGGSFVVRAPYNNNGSILVIAGGGGSGAQNPWSSRTGNNASTSQNGTAGGGNNAGSSGNGAGYVSYGGPAAGFFTDGGGSSGTSSSQYARAFVNGGNGGSGARSWGSYDSKGGFGGGGGSGIAGGGGGGYSGGSGGDWSSNQQGGGGGSYNSGANQSNGISGRSSHGVITVTRL